MATFSLLHIDEPYYNCIDYIHGEKVNDLHYHSSRWKFSISPSVNICVCFLLTFSVSWDHGFPFYKNETITFLNRKIIQECIPVRCVPSAAVAVCLGVSVQGCLPGGGLSAHGDCLPGGCVYPNMHWADTHLWTEKQKPVKT